MKKLPKEIAELIISNPNGYTEGSVKVAKAYIHLLKAFNIYEDNKMFPNK